MSIVLVFLLGMGGSVWSEKYEKISKCIYTTVEGVETFEFVCDPNKASRDYFKDFSAIACESEYGYLFYKERRHQIQFSNCNRKELYIEGEAIGKSSKGGILEPIGIDIKTDRGGLGRDAALKQLKEHRQLIRLNRLKANDSGGAISTDEFRKRMTQRAQGKQMEADLGKCQRACEKLDLEEKIEKPALAWFWPNRQKTEEDDAEEQDESDDDKEEEEGEEEIEYELTEKLEMITNYLRTTYLYCHWCGTKYSDVDDLNSGCPGLSKDDH
ncbi:hypothetical protein HA402_000842 [Bradysia odoriphaga]|nr:hypothetical protein HA402_000842 [Bradysia odoriphaga]